MQVGEDIYFDLKLVTASGGTTSPRQIGGNMHNVHLVDSFDVMEIHMANKRMCNVGDYVTYKTKFGQDEEFIENSSSVHLRIILIYFQEKVACGLLTACVKHKATQKPYCIIQKFEGVIADGVPITNEHT